MMKRITNLLSIIVILFTISIQAQAPQKMSYQAVVRNASGNLVTGVTVGIRISILQGSASGTTVYTETHSAFANSNGLVSIEIGGGNVISGNFGQIDWGSGSYFVKTETDPAGGTNYTISGTSQLLSVPYAFYAAKTGNGGGGRTSIYLVGDLTNAAAQAKLETELGSNTENIYIRDTKFLTNLDLSGATSLVNLIIEGNNDLTSVNLSGLKSIYEVFRVKKNMALTAIQLPAFEFSSGSITIAENPVLTNMSLTHSSRVLANITVQENPALTTLNLSGITYCSSDVLLYMTSTVVDFSGMEIIGKLTVYNAGQVLVPNLQAGNLIISGSALTALNLPNYTTGNFLLTNTNVASLSAPGFTTGNFDVKFNPLLTSISLPAFVNARDGMTISNNALLTSFSFPQFANIMVAGSSSSPNSIFLENNKLPSDQINSILSQMVGVTPTANKNIRVKQLPAAPPTGQGIIDKQALIVAGNTVSTN